MRSFLTCCLVSALAWSASSQDAFLSMLTDELNRQKQEFSGIDEPPYYFSFNVSESQYAFASASYGALINSNDGMSRTGTVDIRVGDYDYDNTSSENDMGGFRGAAPLPIDDNRAALAHILWLYSDLKYKMASYTFNSLPAEPKENKKSFSKSPVVSYFDDQADPKTYKLDMGRWESNVKLFSAFFNDLPNLIDNSVRINQSYNRKYFIDSEGSSIVQNLFNCNLNIEVKVLDNQGQQVSLNKNYSVKSFHELPSKDSILEDLKDLKEQATTLIEAEYVEPYTGPILFSGRSSAVFFHEVLGHRIEAERLEEDHDGQTFLNRLNQPVLPRNFSVYSRPTISEMGDLTLTGGFKYDDQGVKARDVTIISDGILKEFLLSRKPSAGFDQSNGHARSATGSEPTTRQANLIIETVKGKPFDKLRADLIKECKKQKLKFGYYISDVSGGYTTTDRYQPNVINISPLLVYKVYVDGRPDELVKGVTLIGTPLNVFSEIIASGDQPMVFNGYCGAESGYIPVSAVAPSLLVRKMEIQRAPIVKTKLPILPAPSTN